MEACQRPSLPSLFGMPYSHSLSCLLIRRYHMSAVTFLFTTMRSAIPTSPDSGLTSRCGWTAKATPRPPQPPRLVDLLYREDPHILCFREACQRPSLPSLFGMPYGHSLSCLLIRWYHMSAVTFCLLLCVPRYQLAQTPVSPHGAAGQQKQPPPPQHTHTLFLKTVSQPAHSARTSLLPRMVGG